MDKQLPIQQSKAKVLALWDITTPILDNSEKLLKKNSQTDCSFDTKLH